MFIKIVPIKFLDKVLQNLIIASKDVPKGNDTSWKLYFINMFYYFILLKYILQN